MRVAIFTDFIGGLGGTEALTIRTALGLAARGVEVLVLCPRSPSDRTWVRRLRTIDVKVVLGAPERLFPDDAGAIGRAFRESLLDGVTARLAALIFRRWTPDVILANPMGPLMVAWFQLGRSAGIPVVGYEFSAASARCAHWYPPQLRDCVNQLSAVVVGCDASLNGVRDYHGFAGRIVVIPPLVLDASPRPMPASPWKLGCIARLCVEKGLDYLFAALPDLRRRFPEITLYVYGEGYDRSRLDDLSRALGIDDIVTLAGRFDPDAGLDEVVARHALFVQPSLFESVPTAMIEIAARGRAVVASDVGGVGEFFALGGQGALVPPANPVAISTAVSSLLVRPDRLQELGRRNAQVVAEHYNHRNGIDSLINLLRDVQLLRSPPGRPT